MAELVASVLATGDRGETEQPAAAGTPFSRLIGRLAPGEDPAHVEAWMILEHGELEDLNPLHFAREVQNAIGRVHAADVALCDTLAHRFGLEPRRGRGAGAGAGSRRGSGNPAVG